ncbi:MAG TPA: hypothetical protein VI756_00835 [Blastocatellia bacterium]
MSSRTAVADASAKYRTCLGKIVAVCCKTYARMGDAATVADDEALGIILDTIEDEMGESFILENKNKKVTVRR